jgi:hypothetical protein
MEDKHQTRDAVTICWAADRRDTLKEHRHQSASDHNLAYSVIEVVRIRALEVGHDGIETLLYDEFGCSLFRNNDCIAFQEWDNAAK